MDAVILNAGHSQLEEQLKIAAACGVAERKHEEVDEDDENDLNTAVVTACDECGPEDASEESSFCFLFSEI